MQMLEAYKEHPQAYFLYVEDCFLLSDNADAPYIFKSIFSKDRVVDAIKPPRTRRYNRRDAAFFERIF